MSICKYCSIPMVKVMSFSKGRNEKFYKCPGCMGETKRQKPVYDEPDFVEVLNKTIHKK